MSNKKTLPRTTLADAKAIGITSLADRPNQASKYGYGGLSAQDLKERFDKLPNYVRVKYNAVADMLDSTDAPKYITIGKAGEGLGETLFDFFALFGKRGDGIDDKNISDCIETLYQMEGDEGAKSYKLAAIIADIQARQASSDDKINTAIQNAITKVLNTEVEG